MHTPQIIMFDLGGVLTLDLHRLLIKTLISERYPEYDLEGLIAASKPAWRRFSCGEQPSERIFWQETLTATKLEESLETLQEQIRAHMMIHQESVTFAQGLKQQGYHLGLLTNHAQPWFEEVMNRFDLWPLFEPDLIIISYQCGRSKPHPAIYSLLAERLTQYVPAPVHQHCLIFDDKHSNVQAAIDFGFQARLFQQNSAAIKSLEEEFQDLYVK